MYQNSFERKEKKYLLTSTQMKYFQKATADRLEADRYGKHTINSLYLDTEDYSIIRHSIDKPAFKEKIRLRSYGNAKGNSPVYLELKKKLSGITYKRRIQMPYDSALSYILNGDKPDTNEQIFKEIDWFMKYNNFPKPKAFIACDRLAFFDKTNPDIRVTFDFDIRWRNYKLRLGSSEGYRLTEPGICLMEIKIPDAMPMYMSELLSGLETFPTSFSKYGTVYENYLAREEQMRHVI